MILELIAQERKLKIFLRSGGKQLCPFFWLLVHTTAETPGRAVKARKKKKPTATQEGKKQTTSF